MDFASVWSWIWWEVVRMDGSFTAIDVMRGIMQRQGYGVDPDYITDILIAMAEKGMVRRLGGFTGRSWEMVQPVDDIPIDGTVPVSEVDEME